MTIPSTANRGVVRHARAYIAGINVFLRARVTIRSSTRLRHQASCNLADVTRVAHDFVEVGAHDAPEPRQRDRRLAMKQRAAQLTLQRADGAGQRGLRDAAAAGGAGETELLAQRQEVMDLLHLHWVALRFDPIIAPAALVGGMLQG